jgi:glutamine cyclotransferase
MKPYIMFMLLTAVPSLSCSDNVSQPKNEPPDCEIVSPADGSPFTFGDSVIVRADAADADGTIASVAFYAPFIYVLSNLAYRIGGHAIKAIATDDGGLESDDLVGITISSAQTPIYKAVVKKTFDHDPDAFTEGLVYDDGKLYEGTGLSGKSSLRLVELETGRVLMQRDIPSGYFGEGIAVWGSKIYQLTWKSHVGFVYGLASFDSLSTFSYDTEGWGLTNDDQRLIMSDGTSNIYFRDPETFGVIGKIVARDKGVSVPRLNELEYVEGDLFANVLNNDRIARIDLETGEVVGWIDLSDISEPYTGVLNGIAYDRVSGRLFVTGKNWDTLYEIELTF